MFSWLTEGNILFSYDQDALNYGGVKFTYICMSLHEPNVKSPRTIYIADGTELAFLRLLDKWNRLGDFRWKYYRKEF